MMNYRKWKIVSQENIKKFNLFFKNMLVDYEKYDLT